MPLPTAADIRAISVKGLTGTGADARLDTLIAAADAAFAAYCLYPQLTDGRTMEATSYIFYVNGPDRNDPRVLWLPSPPLVSVDDLATDTNGDFSYATTWGIGDLAVEYPRPVVFRHPNGRYDFLHGLRANRVEVTAGFDVGATPNLVAAIALQVGAWWASPGGTAAGIASTSQGGSSVNFVVPAAALLPEVRGLLAPFVLRNREGLSR